MTLKGNKGPNIFCYDMMCNTSVWNKTKQIQNQTKPKNPNKATIKMESTMCKIHITQDDDALLYC